MAVPDTPSVRLSDVINEVGPSLWSLEGCFTDADPALFDPAYAKGGAEHWLSEFRNYGAVDPGTWSKTYLFGSTNNGSYLDPGCSAANINNTDANWFIARDASAGDDIDFFDGGYYIASMQAIGGLYKFKRFNITFDLRSFPNPRTCYGAELHLCIESGTFGTDNLAVLFSTAHPEVDCLELEDYDEFNFNSFELEGTVSTYTSGGYTWLKIEASASDLNTIGINRFGTYWNLMVIEKDYDHDSAVPGDTTLHGFSFYRPLNGYPLLQPFLMIKS